MHSKRTESWPHTRDLYSFDQTDSSGEELTASEELGTICSPTASSESQYGQSGEESDTDSYSEYGMPSSSDDDTDRIRDMQSERNLLTDRHSVARRLKTFSVHRKANENSLDGDHSLHIDSCEDCKKTQQSTDTSDPPHNRESTQFLPEISSPDRPLLRPPSATAKDLIEIHRNYRQAASQEWPVLLPPNMDEDLQNLDHIDPTKRPRYLPLAPPYHLLPNTQFFRKTFIKPPPTYCSDGLPPLKRIINRYLASMLADHLKCEEELRIFLQETRKKNHSNLQANTKEMKEEEETNIEAEMTPQDEHPADNQSRRERRSRVVLQHLIYGGQLIHYIQGDSEPPSIPGYFTISPLIPSNVAITSELGETGSAEYQQQRATHGLYFLPIGLLKEERCADLSSALPVSSTSPRANSPQKDHSQEALAAPDVVNEFVDTGGCEAVPEYNVVATERYASISITQISLKLQFAEKRKFHSISYYFATVVVLNHFLHS